MGNRILKESICESKGLSEVSFFAADLYKRLITYADDYGRFNADFQILRARLYPREIEIVSIEDIEDAMTELIGVGKVAFFTSIARKEIYGCFPNWFEHQRQRETKQKIPEPDDTSVNDWYLRRFIPLALKAELLERDGFKCQECGKYISSGNIPAYKFVKMATGTFHVDHIVPLSQGGRASKENLRILCPECNLKRKRSFTPDEIVEITLSGKDSPQVAASRGKLPPESEYESEYEKESEKKDKRKKNSFVPPTLDEVKAYAAERNSAVDPVKFYEFYAAGHWKDSKGNPVKNWKQKFLTWENKDGKKGKSYTQESYGFTASDVKRLFEG